MKYLFLAIGGLIGVIGRYQLGVWISEWNPSQFPWATLVINVSGSLAIGFFMRYLTGVASSTNVRLMFTTGLCGGYTTMSTFSYEVVNLFTERQYGLGILYLSSTMVLAPLACLAGFAIAEMAL
ncbi:MAG TPA: fluoride efflux transporter CrcB [Candidatus Kapabacteria bacterium]|jgi:CrcB protein